MSGCNNAGNGGPVDGSPGSDTPRDLQTTHVNHCYLHLPGNPIAARLSNIRIDPPAHTTLKDDVEIVYQKVSADSLKLTWHAHMSLLQGLSALTLFAPSMLSEHKDLEQPALLHGPILLVFAKVSAPWESPAIWRSVVLAKLVDGINTEKVAIQDLVVHLLEQFRK